VEKSQAQKAGTEKFITRFARVYTPIVCILALALAVIPSVLLGGSGQVWRTWIYRALELLVVSCPCALVISVPLSFFAGIGMASKKGILVKGANYIEMLEKTKTVVFDKTGTLTQGVFEVTEVHPSENAGITKEELLALATHAEYFSNHPISRSLKMAHSCPVCKSLSERLTAQNVEEISGNGVKAVIDGKTILVGNLRFLKNQNVKNLPQEVPVSASALVHISVNGEYQGYVVISDCAKKDAKESITALKKNGIRRTVMLTGDNSQVAEAVAKELSIDQVYAELLPENKVQKIEEEMSLYNGTKNRVAFVGDGINDAPVLTRSDVGIAMGAMGSDSAIEAADVVIMDDSIEKVNLAIRLSKKTMSNVWQNVFFALGVKTLIMVLCAMGIANMWLAVFGDVGVTMLAVLNSMRLLIGKK
jgi:Cd2+/Zn2+-exporting ATPase